MHQRRRKNRGVRLPHLPGRLTYCAYNDANKSAAEHFGLHNPRFMTHGARIGAATAQFAENKDVSAIKLAEGWKSQSSAEQYLRNGRAAMAALDITSD